MVLVSLTERIQADLIAAIKGKREPERTLLRSLTAALKNAEIEAAGPLNDTQATAVLVKQAKRREEAATAAAGRPELAARERDEAVIIARYLPEPLSSDELAPLVDEAIRETGAASPADMGKVMGALKEKTAGRADQSSVAQLVKERLSA